MRPAPGAAALVGDHDLLPSVHGLPGTQFPVLLEDNHLRVITADHYHALREALYKNTFARVEGQPWPTADLRPAGVAGQAILRPPAADSGAAVPAEQVEHWARAMWRQQKELSDLDADALDALCAIWLYQARTVQDRAVADIDGLLAMRGIQPRKREYGDRKRVGYEKEQRDEMMRAVAHIQNLWINVGEAAATDDGAGGPTRVVQSRAFVVTDRVGQIDFSGEMVDIERFVFRPGEVFAHYLMGPGSQTALLSARALKYDRTGRSPRNDSRGSSAGSGARRHQRQAVPTVPGPDTTRRGRQGDRYPLSPPHARSPGKGARHAEGRCGHRRLALSGMG